MATCCRSLADRRSLSSSRATTTCPSGSPRAYGAEAAAPARPAVRPDSGESPAQGMDRRTVRVPQQRSVLTNERCRTARRHPRTSRRATYLQPVRQPDHARLRCMHRRRHLHRARPSRKRGGAHGRRLGAGHRRDRRRTGNGRAGVRQRPLSTLFRTPLRKPSPAAEWRLPGRSRRERRVPGDAASRHRAPHRQDGAAARPRRAARARHRGGHRLRALGAPRSGARRACRSMCSMPRPSMHAGRVAAELDRRPQTLAGSDRRRHRQSNCTLEASHRSDRTVHESKPGTAPELQRSRPRSASR